MYRIKFTKKKIVSAIIVLIISIIAQFIIPNKQQKTTITPTPTPSKPQYVKVVRVIDGDTIEIENKIKVRYIGIDTPELHDPRRPVQCFATDAYLKNKELVEGKTVRLEKDVSETDKYGRLLRYIYVDNSSTNSGQLFVNNFLVEKGFAHMATYPPDVKYAGLFKQSQQQAAVNNLGLWNSCPISP
jgi:micrococcal nuclease